MPRSSADVCIIEMVADGDRVLGFVICQCTERIDNVVNGDKCRF